MLDEVIDNVSARSLQLDLMDRSVIELLVEKKKKEMADVLALLE